MKKILPIILPSLLIFTLVSVDHFMLSEDSLYLVVWVWLAFPIIFIIQGVVCSSSRKSMIIGFLLSSITVIITISKWYNVGSMIIPVIIYTFLGVISFFLSKYISKSNILNCKTKEVE